MIDIAILEKLNIGYFFYIGGNDSMDTIAKLSRYGAQVHLVPASGPDISSTEIRRRVARGQSTEGLLPGAVRAYIDRENLYRL